LLSGEGGMSLVELVVGFVEVVDLFVESEDDVLFLF
jgi:hypothetical protein